MDDHDEESLKAAAHLGRLAIVTAMLRMFREEVGRPATSVREVEEWWGLKPRPHIEPTDADYAVVRREHPDLEVLANRSNPFLSGRN